MPKNIFTKPKNFWVSLFFLSLVGFTYWKLTEHFFEQDEWMGLGHLFVLGSKILTEGGNLYEVFFFGAGRPLATLINSIFYTLFGFNTLPLALFSIFLQATTMYFLFVLLRRLGSGFWVSLFATTFFGINATSAQVVTWFSSLAVILSSLFLVVSTIVFVDFVNSKDTKKLVLSFIMFYLSFLTKEINVLFGLLFLLYHYRFGGKNIRKSLIVSLPFLAIGILSFSRYIWSFFLRSEQVGLIIKSSSLGPRLLLENLILVPTASFSQIFIPPEKMYLFTRKIFFLFKGFDPGDLVVQTTLATQFSVAISVVLVVLIIYLYRRGFLARRNLLMGFLVYLLAVSPYVIIQKGGSAYLEGRYYYLAVLGVSVIFAGLKGLEKQGKQRVLLFFILLLYLIMQAGAIQSSLSRKVEFSRRRIDLVQKLMSIDLKENKRNVFYIASDQEYLGQPLPFQQGIGYTLMVIYYPQGVIPEEFLAKNHLWNIGSQGYFEFQPFGFGYFSDKEALGEFMTQKKISDYKLISLEYKGGELFKDGKKL